MYDIALNEAKYKKNGLRIFQLIPFKSLRLDLIKDLRTSLLLEQIWKAPRKLTEDGPRRKKSQGMKGLTQKVETDD